MRVSVQVRTSVGGEGRRWQRSVYLDETPRDVVVALGDMRPVAPGGAGPIPVRDLRALLFVVDTVNTRPGSSGQVTFDRIRFCLASLRRPSRQPCPGASPVASDPVTCAR